MALFTRSGGFLTPFAFPRLPVPPLPPTDPRSGDPDKPSVPWAPPPPPPPPAPPPPAPPPPAPPPPAPPPKTPLSRSPGFRFVPDMPVDPGTPVDPGGPGIDPGGRTVPAIPAEPPMGPPDDVPSDLGPTPSGQTPDLTALLRLAGRGGGASSPGLQGLLESLMSGIGGGQARQRYGRQFQTYLANQRMAQSQRAEMAGMDQGADQDFASPLQGQMQMQAALDRLRTALDMPSRTPVSRRAPQFASSSSTSGGGLTATSPYLY
mgnify:CR=1 FL=1